ncbi:MAG: hypothetical protein WBX11_08205 [Thiobacillaceae bacterium]
MSLAPHASGAPLPPYMEGRKIRQRAASNPAAFNRRPHACNVLLVSGKHMILAALVLFCLAVALGLYLVVLGVRYRRGSRTLAAVHAGIAVVGLGLLGKQVFDYPKHILYNDAALVFALALSGGLVLLALRLGEPNRHAPPSMIGVSLHAAMALLGLLLLVLGYARY